jgi:hypothetical protein
MSNEGALSQQKDFLNHTGEFVGAFGSSFDIPLCGGLIVCFSL